MDTLPNLSSTELTTLIDFAKGLPAGRTEHLDPTNAIHNDVIRLALRTGGFTEDRYPALYRALQPGAQPGGAVQDTLMLVDAGKTEAGQATATVWASVGGETLITGGVLFAFDPKVGEVVACGENTALGSGFLTCPTRAALAQDAPPEGLSLFHLNYATDPSGASRFFAIAAQASVGDGIQATVTQPVISKPNHTAVEISVGRMSGYQNNDCDYIYLNPTGSGNDDSPFLVCPFVGSVALSGTPNLSALTISNLTTNIVVDNTGTGDSTIARASQYTTDAKLIGALGSGSAPNILTWSYPYDGPSKYYMNTSSLVYNKSALQSEIITYFYYMFDIPMQNGQPNQTFYVCSKDSPEAHSVNCTKIDNLLFWWHCAVKGTLVTLESGERLPIEEINNGHRVRSADGTTWAVRATRHGRHVSGDGATGVAAVYRIETAGGHSLSASGAHLIALADGSFRQICDIAIGDMVVALEGATRVTGQSVIAYDGVCYSLALGDEDEHAADGFPTDAAIYFAGGIGCGDHMAMRAYTLRVRYDLEAMLRRADSALHIDLKSAFADRRF